MPNTWAIDIETIPGPPQSLQWLRKQEADIMAKEIEGDRLASKGERKYIQQNLTDPVKIDAAIASKLQQSGQLIHDKDALDPMTATPIIVCCFNADYCLKNYSQCCAGASEGALEIFTDIQAFYRWAYNYADQFLGFNISNFDLPCLRLHQAKMTSTIAGYISALWREGYDLCRIFGDKWNNYPTPHTLKNYVATILDREAQHQGVIREYLESTFTGADVAQAYVDTPSRMDEIIRHCTLDALMAALIAVKMGIYR